MIDLIRKIDCTGCKMCKDVCPADAIFYETDYDGQKGKPAGLHP